ncbi:A-type R2R3 Myb protein [Musa troglodytarum]|uniref:A-type R2R3 Myb protein n=1 Tax=Musa troglodytarum TaxID=320322 RepID=A0A9E7H868_9LILI|nr:A-type R2R3 Myb protein [Musa troglodytarum]
MVSDPLLVSLSMGIGRAVEVWEELQAQVDKLPQIGPEEREHHQGGGRGHHEAARHTRKQYFTMFSVPSAASESESEHRGHVL